MADWCRSIGTAEDESGTTEGHLIELLTTPVATITAFDGSFVLLGTAGDYNLRAVAAGTSDNIAVPGDTATALTPIVIPAVPPTLQDVIVRRPRVQGNFAGPLALLGIPAPIVVDGNGKGVLEPD